jgi:hypothetical protein
VIKETDEGTFGRCRLHNKRQRLFFGGASLHKEREIRDKNWTIPIRLTRCSLNKSEKTAAVFLRNLADFAFSCGHTPFPAKYARIFLR